MVYNFTSYFRIPHQTGQRHPRASDCDVDDRIGCAKGLVCGQNNCAKFHKLDAKTGISSGADCCEHPPVVYPECQGHWGCGPNRFCGTVCWTGKCGKDGKVRKGTQGKFCQPCEECQTPDNSVTGSCNICPVDFGRGWRGGEGVKGEEGGEDEGRGEGVRAGNGRRGEQQLE